MKPFGIRKQTLLVALIPILVMAVLLENYFIFSRFADLENALLERSKMLVHQLASSSEYAVFSNNTALLQQNVDAVLTQQDVSNVIGCLGKTADGWLRREATAFRNPVGKSR